MVGTDILIEQAKAMLSRPLKMLIGGSLVSSSDGAFLPSINPATREILAHIPNASAEDVEAAVRAASQSARSWRHTTMQERRTVIRKIEKVLRENAGLLGLLDTLDNGNVYSGMAKDADMAADAMDYFSGVALDLKGEFTARDGNLHYTTREPFGVVLRLLPFNHPILKVGTGIAAPLLAGNAVIVKPSPHTSVSALAFAEMIRDIVPPGVVNIVTGDNNRVSTPLAMHPKIPRIGLTGSVEAGIAIMRMASERLASVSLELGGKNPLIVFPDSDVDHAVDVALRGMNFLWQGHSCSSTSRILVHEDIKKDFVSRLASRIASVRVAMPLDPRAEMGAITFEALYERCKAYIRSGIDQGAKLLVGGEAPSDPELKRGLFLTPALFDSVNPTMRISREEIFGPVLSVLSWTNYDDMIAMANELDLGLTAIIVTNDLKTAHRTAGLVEAGYIEVNGPVSFATGSPFGGVKMSGIGREGCAEELLSYTQTKSVNIRMN